MQLNRSKILNGLGSISKLVMMNNKLAAVILWAFILNTVWEFGQCIWFYNMWSWSFWKSTIWMWAAVFGDILIVLGLWKITTLLVPSVYFYRPNSTGFAVLLLVSFVASVFLEWIALYLELWSYDSGMPVVTIDDHQVGSYTYSTDYASAGFKYLCCRQV